MNLPDLPVNEVLPALRTALAEQRSAVLVAPPGAGKTTVVPLALLEEAWLEGRNIVVLEPRRLAARAAASRMATLLGERDAGGTVGYRIRMDTRVGSETRIEVVTEGVLTRMLQSDPALEEVGLVAFDEYHERSLPADLGLALALQARRLFRADLRLLVMSATLDAAPVAELLDGAEVIETGGRQYPVETRYRDRAIDGRIEPPVVRAVSRALEHEEGDVLVFLPGAGEIRRTVERLEDLGLPAEVDLYPLFGNLPRKQQDLAIAPSPPGRRKVVLATSIAQTSLTIEGVRVVIDSGLIRLPRFDPGTGMTRLETLRVTRDVADQRRGRAGRTTPGVCHRLWTRGEDAGLIPGQRAEILEADLASLALELLVWGAGPDELHWLDPPPEPAHARALELLEELEAIGKDGEVTAHGRRMADVGLHPRLAHMLIRGDELDLGALACDLVALLGHRDVLRAEGRRAPEADLRLRAEVLRRTRAGSEPGYLRGHTVDRGRLARTLRQARHWRQLLGVPRGMEVSVDAVECTGLLTALAYPDRVAKRRQGSRGRFLLRNGRGARFEEEQLLSGSDWIVAAEVEASGREARIFRAAPLDLDEIEDQFGSQVAELEEVVWDPGKGRVEARRRRMLGALVLAESPLRETDPDAVASALLEGIRDAGLRVLPWTKSARQLQQRLRFLHGVDPETWPDFSRQALESTLGDWLLPFLSGIQDLDELERLDLFQALMTRVGWDRRERLDELAPTHLQVPSGSRIALDYSDPEAPTLAVRIQEIFGWRRTPEIAGGRVPVTLELLSPAHRPTQITTDLASFWRKTYFEVKKDLMGRYPKHYWPDDPLQAAATRGTKPRD